MNKETEKKVLELLLQGKNSTEVKNQLDLHERDVSQVIKDCGLKKLRKVRKGTDTHVSIEHVLDELKQQNPDLDFSGDVYFDASVEDGSVTLDFYDIKWKKA